MKTWRKQDKSGIVVNVSRLVNISKRVDLPRHNILTEIMQATTMDNLRRAKGGTGVRSVESEAVNEATKMQSNLLR